MPSSFALDLELENGEDDVGCIYAGKVRLRRVCGWHTCQVCDRGRQGRGASQRVSSATTTSGHCLASPRQRSLARKTWTRSLVLMRSRYRLVLVSTGSHAIGETPGIHPTVCDLPACLSLSTSSARSPARRNQISHKR